MERTKKELEYKDTHGIEVDACDWCPQVYPLAAKERFYYIRMYSGEMKGMVTRKICGDCYDRLKGVHTNE